MKYLIKNNEVLFAGNFKEIFVYIFCTFKLGLKEFIKSPLPFNSRYKNFLELINFSIKNEIPYDRKTIGLVITEEEFKKVWLRCYKDIRMTAMKLHTSEHLVSTMVSRLNGCVSNR